MCVCHPQIKGYIQGHSHVDIGSNSRLRDTINKVEDLLRTAASLNYDGIAITDHESLSAHVKTLTIAKDLKQKGVLKEDFKVILGNEIYLVDSIEEVREGYQSKVTKFPHFLLLAKNAEGHRLLRKLSSKAWENRFVTGLMERVPISKQEVVDIIGNNKGHLIASTACLGSTLAIKSLELHKYEESKDIVNIKRVKKEINEFIQWCINTFEKDNFFIELQPAYSPEQMIYNKKALEVARAYDLKTIVTTDAHYLRPEDSVIHSAFLKSKDEDRETESFYEACFLQTTDEIIERLTFGGNLTEKVAIEAINNTLLLREMIEDYDLKRPITVPKIKLPEFELRHLFRKGYEQYSYIKRVAYSEHEQDRYYLKLIEDGFVGKVPYKIISTEQFHEILARIDIELEELWHISDSINDRVTDYYITLREIILMMWDESECGGNSIVGIGRGSAVGFYTNYLLGIVEVNPIKYNLPHWRHLTKTRPEMPDVDLDSEAAKRPRILNALKNKFGHRRVLNICTFRTEKSRSALLTSCRGLGIDNDTAQYLSSLIPFERGATWTIRDCLFGNKDEGKEPLTNFINEIEKYPLLKETVLKIEGLVSGRGIHASGVYIFNEDFEEQNTLMTSPKGQWTTQFSMEDSDYMGGLKFDNLTVEFLDKQRATMEFLLKDELMKYQGSLKKTYDHYLHPDTIDLDDKMLWKVVGNSEMIDMFQFNTQVGIDAIKKVQPQTVADMSVANSLLRLMAEGDNAQPLEIYEKFRKNISLWYEEMEHFGLSEEEIEVFEKHLKHKYGVADSQESVMMLVMDEKIGNFDIKDANLLRKGIGKKNREVIEKARQTFYKKGKENGASQAVLDYTWEVQIKRQLGYSFSDLHNYAYTLIGLQGAKLYTQYDPLYWNTAVLSVNSASNDTDEFEVLDDEEETKNKNKSTDYGRVASAIGLIRQNGVQVSLPDINKADFGFKPDIPNQQIVFGIKGMIGIGDDAANLIIANRPYKSFDDFLNKTYFKDKKTEDKLDNKHVIQLIKAGAFDSFGDRVEIMKQFINILHSPSKKLTMANLNGLLNANLIPEGYEQEQKHYNFKKYINEHFSDKHKSNKTYIIKDNYTINYFNTHFSEVEHEFLEDGSLTFRENKLDKVYNKLIEPLKSLITDDKMLILYNDFQYQQLWNKHASGTISKWEMDSLCFYYHDHELAHVNREKYNINNYFELPEDPVILRKEIYGNNKTFTRYDLCGIIGTVIHKDKNKHTVSLLTPEGVVIVKYYDGAFANYNRNISKINSDGVKETIEKSWFTRGNKLYVQGYRRGSQFKPQKYNDSFAKHTTMLITDIKDNGELVVSMERKRIE